MGEPINLLIVSQKVAEEPVDREELKWSDRGEVALTFWLINWPR